MAPRSLSLSAYLALTRRGNGQPVYATEAERPAGELIWGHASNIDHAHALVQLAARLAQLRPDLTLLLTTPASMADIPLSASCLIREVLPEDTVANGEAFIDHWMPELCLWTGGDLQPAILNCAANADLPMFLVDANEEGIVKPGWRWFPDMPRALLNSFSMILVQNTETVTALRRLGVRDTDIAVTGIFQEGTLPLPCNEDERQELSDLLKTRPVWLAAMAQAEELDIILAAHRQVSRMTHRLLLILVPDKEADGPEFAARLQAEGYEFTRWSEGTLPEETTQILLGDTHGDMGLWYRLASVSMMCSSLKPGYGGQDPNEPAAHGSAILYGPNVSRYLTAYKRYAGAGAARIVRDEDTLAAALKRLIAPDQSAAMAHAAWDVASLGAEVTDRILDLVQDTLDVLEAV